MLALNRISLRSKLFLAIYCPCLIFSLIAAVAFTLSRFETIDRNFKEGITKATTQMVVSTEYALANSDEKMLSHLLSILLKFDHINSVQLYSFEKNSS
ncbi:hypothetical protein [Marinomonas balearica]|uniref:hypothetical protein n=1 Tax=Marinomonas balearica TaxID=491947 RepID=UPI001FB7BAA0|nr:hypothetical protein [Marinomonas balearica]